MPANLTPAARIIIAATMLAILILGMTLFRATDNRSMLQAIQAKALPLFEDTAHVIDPGFEPAGPQDIVGDPFGFQHCDGWRGWFWPKWIAATWHDVDVDDAERRAGIIADVRSLWERQDGVLTVSDPYSLRPLHLRTGEITYSLTFPENSGFLVPEDTVTVGIACLPGY